MTETWLQQVIMSVNKTAPLVLLGFPMIQVSDCWVM